MKVRVYLATTRGAVLIERISREPAPQSAICLKRTTKVLPVSAGYDAFVRQPSGVVEREFGPFEEGGFRLDVSGEVADGESWQLGIFVAHALKEAGELAGAEDAFDEVWWLTGEVDNDLNIQPVAHLHDKIRTAAVDINALVESGKPVTLFVAEENISGVDRAELPYGVRVVGVSTTAEVLDGIGHTTPLPTLGSKDQASQPVPWPGRAAGADRSGLSAARRSSAVAVIGAGTLALAVILIVVFGVDLFEQPPAPEPVTVAITPPPQNLAEIQEQAAQPSQAPVSIQTDQKGEPRPQPATTDATPAPSAIIADAIEAPKRSAAPSPNEPKQPGVALAPTQSSAVNRNNVRNLIEIKVFALFPADQANCAAVHFGGAKTVNEPIGLASTGTYKTLPVDDLCAIEIEITPRGGPLYVRAILDVEGSNFVEPQRWPAIFTGARPLETPIRWRGDLPKRLLAPLSYRFFIASSAAELSWLSDAMIRGSSATEAGVAELSKRGVALIQRHHTIRPF